MEINKTLYEISHEIMVELENVSNVGENGELVIDADAIAFAKIDSMFASFDQKVESYAGAMCEYAARAAAVMDEADRLYERASRFKKRSERIKEHMRQSMMMTGTDKVVSDRFTISLRKTPDKVNVEDPAKLPGEYLSATIDCEGTDLSVIFDALGSIPGTVTLKPLKKDILAAVNAGQTFDGVTVTSDKTLVVK